VEHVEDHAGRDRTRGMPLVGRYVKDLPRLQDVRGTGDRQLEGAAEEQGPLLVGMRVLGDDGARSDIDSAPG
jgi:hypothetical protein